LKQGIEISKERANLLVKVASELDKPRQGGQ